VTSVTDLHVVTLVAAKTVAHAATSLIVLHGHPLVTDQLAQALVTGHHVRILATGHPAQAEHRAAEASASSVGQDLAVAHADQRSSVLSADSKNILSNTFRQDVFLMSGIKLAGNQGIMFTSLRSRLLQDSDQVCDDAFVLALDEKITDVNLAMEALSQGFTLAARLMRRKYGMLQAVVILPDAVFDVDYRKVAEHAFGADHENLVVLTVKTKPDQNVSQQIARGAEYCSPNASIRGVVSRQQPGYVLATVSTGASTTTPFLSSRMVA
jgi:hypothetical protein